MEEKKWKEKGERVSYSLQKETVGCISSLPPPPPNTPTEAQANFWPTVLSGERRGYQKPDPGGDHYYVGCLGQTRVSLPE